MSCSRFCRRPNDGQARLRSTVQHCEVFTLPESTLPAVGPAFRPRACTHPGLKGGVDVLSPPALLPLPEGVVHRFPVGEISGRQAPRLSITFDGEEGVHPITAICSGGSPSGLGRGDHGPGTAHPASPLSVGGVQGRGTQKLDDPQDRASPDAFRTVFSPTPTGGTPGFRRRGVSCGCLSRCRDSRPGQSRYWGRRERDGASGQGESGQGGETGGASSGASPVGVRERGGMEGAQA